MIFLEPIHDFLQRRIVLELEAIPQCPFRLAIFVRRRSDWLGEAEEWQSQVHKSILVTLELLLSIDNLNRQC